MAAASGMAASVPKVPWAVGISPTPKHDESKRASLSRREALRNDSMTSGLGGRRYFIGKHQYHHESAKEQKHEKPPSPFFVLSSFRVFVVAFLIFLTCDLR
jgi:hypothetical protein